MQKNLFLLVAILVLTDLSYPIFRMKKKRNFSRYADNMALI